jgi:antitoxin MazE
MDKISTLTTFGQWGNGTALRLNKTVLRTAGFSDDASVRLLVEPGRIVIEPAQRRATLDEMLASFDPVIHGGEAMAFEPVGEEAV